MACQSRRSESRAPGTNNGGGTIHEITLTTQKVLSGLLAVSFCLLLFRGSFAALVLTYARVVLVFCKHATRET